MVESFIRRKSICSILLVSSFVVISDLEAFAAPPDMDGKWTQTFSSEFGKPEQAGSDKAFVIEDYDDYASESDEAKWEYRDGFIKGSIGSGENAFLATDPETGEDALVLRTSALNNKSDLQRNNLRTGYIRTRNYHTTGPDAETTFEQKYGYFETRMKIDSAPGQWAAFWLMPKARVACEDGSGRDGTEIDIVEGFPANPGFQDNRNGDVNMAIHYDGYAKAHKNIHNTFPDRKRNKAHPFRSDEYHEYGFLWGPDKYVWFVDGEEVFRIEDQNLISQVPKYLKLSTEVQQEWAGQLEAKRLPADTYVDWVRVWQKDTWTNELAPLVIEAEASDNEISDNLEQIKVEHGTDCKGVFLRRHTGQNGRITAPIENPVDVSEVAVRFRNPSAHKHQIKLFVGKQLVRKWKTKREAGMFIVKHDLKRPIEKPLSIEWEGNLEIDQIILYK